MKKKEERKKRREKRRECILRRRVLRVGVVLSTTATTSTTTKTTFIRIVIEWRLRMWGRWWKNVLILLAIKAILIELLYCCSQYTRIVSLFEALYTGERESWCRPAGGPANYQAAVWLIPNQVIAAAWRDVIWGHMAWRPRGVYLPPSFPRRACLLTPDDVAGSFKFRKKKKQEHLPALSGQFWEITYPLVIVIPNPTISKLFTRLHPPDNCWTAVLR